MTFSFLTGQQSFTEAVFYCIQSNVNFVTNLDFQLALGVFELLSRDGGLRFQTGVNQYNEQPDALKEGEELYLTACSGCHGHTAEGKLGPGLNDSYWTYPKNETDKGLFETIYGGAQGMMGPQYGHLNLDEMLKVMAWTRHLLTGDPSEAMWLTREQRQSFKPYGSEGG